jgi:hypothetical protein
MTFWNDVTFWIDVTFRQRVQRGQQTSEEEV